MGNHAVSRPRLPITENTLLNLEFDYLDQSTALAFYTNTDLALRAAFELRRKGYTNAPDRPLSTGLTGSDKLVTFSAAKPMQRGYRRRLKRPDAGLSG
jgi:hypothetical protein